jgi:hypothetical protein
VALSWLFRVIELMQTGVDAVQRVHRLGDVKAPAIDPLVGPEGLLAERRAEPAHQPVMSVEQAFNFDIAIALIVIGYYF